MATATHGGHNYHERRSGERRRIAYASLLRGADGMRVSWGGIFAGVLVALGVLLLLAALGVAVGISAADPGQTEAATLGTGAGIWAAASLLVALFVGGMVSTRLGAIWDGTTSLFEGVLVWVVALLLMGYLASSGIGALAGGAFKLVGGAGMAIGTVMQGNQDMGSGNVDQILQRLKDPQTAQSIAQATGLQQGEVQSTLSQTAERVERNRDNPGQAAAEAKRGVQQLYDKAKSSGALQQKAEEVKPKATAAAWIALGALVVSLLAAVIGAMVGRREPRVAAATP